MITCKFWLKLIIVNSKYPPVNLFKDIIFHNFAVVIMYLNIYSKVKLLYI